jgi:tetratricopeptide (TPR) repeat protein
LVCIRARTSAPPRPPAWPANRPGQALTELARAHLITEHAPGRYSFHDLLRAYAAELCGTDEREAADRMLDHYLNTANTADLLLFRHGEVTAVEAPRSGVSPEQLDDEVAALAWFAAERQILLALVRYAADHDRHDHACRLAWSLFVYLHRQGHWNDRVATQHLALESARRLGDANAEARAHRQLGFAYADLGRYDDAHVHLTLALGIGDDTGRARTYHYRDLVHGRQGHDAEALADARAALRLFERVGHEVGTAVARTDVGWYHGRLGDHDSALTFCTRALTEHERLGNRSYLAHTWSCLADTYAGRGDRAEAIRCSEQALPLFRELGDRYGEASTLVRLGDLHDDAGIANTARAQAATILADFDTSAADQARSTDIKSP